MTDGESWVAFAAAALGALATSTSNVEDDAANAVSLADVMLARYKDRNFNYED